MPAAAAVATNSAIAMGNEISLFLSGTMKKLGAGAAKVWCFDCLLLIHDVSIIIYYLTFAIY